MSKVCLDAGHYAKYNRSPGISEYWESERMWKLTELLATALKKKGVTVVKTRTNQAIDLALVNRGKAAQGCDLFLSIHSNAVGSGMNESVDYPVAYVMLDGSSTDIGLKLAEIVQKQMETTQKARTATRATSSGGEYYGVLRGAKAVGVPGLILEHSFHTNTKATNWLLSDANLKKLAEAEAVCIADWLKNNASKTTTTTTTTTASITVDPAMGFTTAYKKTYTVNASGLNMRTGAGGTKDIIKVLHRGDKFTCYGYFTKFNGTVWLLGVDEAGATGFCSKDYLK